jgi:hypothetical protein
MADNSTRRRLLTATHRVAFPVQTGIAFALFLVAFTAAASEPDTGLLETPPTLIAAALQPAAVNTASVPTIDNISTVDEIGPWVHPHMPAGVARKLDAAFEIALEKVREPGCAELFARLGADAVESLRGGLYFPANPRRETRSCNRSLAQSYVGSPTTWICRRITSHSDEAVAAVLIHEALHHAGMDEDMHGRKAKTSGSITETVKASCDLEAH